MKEKTNIILLATYWDEIDWIKPSLEQIDKINPIEVIICDGCFDPKIKNPHSTDGTREIIAEWVAKHDNARLISPIRTNKTRAFLRLFSLHNKLSFKNYLFPSRLFSAIGGLRKSNYRINQALTFNMMISLSKHWTRRPICVPPTSMTLFISCLITPRL